METLTLEVALHPEHAKRLRELLKISPDYVSDLLTLKLARAEIYSGMKERDDGR